MSHVQRDFNLYCSYGGRFTERALDILQAHSDVDVMADEGLAFKRAIRGNNPELLRALLAYYEQHKPENVESAEYKEYIGKFHRTLEHEIMPAFTNSFTGEYVFSESIHDALKSYLDDNEEDEHDLGSDEDEEYIISPSNPASFKMLQSKMPQPTLDLSEAIIAGCSADSSHSDQKSSDEDDIPPPDFCGWPDSLAHRHLSGDNGDGLSHEVY